MRGCRVATIEFIDEENRRVVTLEWDDLDNLPDFDEPPPGSRVRRATKKDMDVDFIRELRRLNSSFLTAA